MGTDFAYILAAIAPLSAEEALDNLQTMFDREQFLASNNLVTKKGACEDQGNDPNSPEACTRQAIIQVVEIIKCPTCKTNKKTIVVRRCIWHGLLRFGAGIEFSTEMLNIMNGKAPLVPGDPDEFKDMHEHKRVEDPIVLDGTSGSIKTHKHDDDISDETAVVQDPEDPVSCICGERIASRMDGHARRHAEFIERRHAHA